MPNWFAALQNVADDNNEIRNAWKILDVSDFKIGINEKNYTYYRIQVISMKMIWKQVLKLGAGEG